MLPNRIWIYLIRLYFSNVASYQKIWVVYKAKSSKYCRHIPHYEGWTCVFRYSSWCNVTSIDQLQISFNQIAKLEKKAKSTIPPLPFDLWNWISIHSVPERHPQNEEWPNPPETSFAHWNSAVTLLCTVWLRCFFLHHEFPIVHFSITVWKGKIYRYAPFKLL